MKTSIWDILTGITLFGILCMIVIFGIMLTQEQPAAPVVVQPIATIALPTSTNTLPALPPTWTPTPSPTFLIQVRPTSTLPATNTPVVLPTFTKAARTLVSSGPGTCRILLQNPVDNSSLARGTDFQMYWRIQNLSENTWRRDSVDIRYVSGKPLQTGPDSYDLSVDVPTNAYYDLYINMQTPDTGGAVSSHWVIANGSTVLCRFYVELNIP